MSYVIDNNLTISEILQALIKERGLSISELARRVNLPQPTVQRIAAGLYKRPQVKTMKALTDFFKITSDQLLGLEVIPRLKANSIYRKIPLLTSKQVLHWPDLPATHNLDQHVILDIEAGEKTFAMEMPDPSMEPLIPQHSILIIDPDVTPVYRSYVVVKLSDSNEFIVRQLIIDAKNNFIKPLSPDFDHHSPALLKKQDVIKGVVVQVRLNFIK